MIFSLSSSDQRKINELLLAALCISLFITRAAIPFLKIPFLILFLAAVVYIFARYRPRIIPCLKSMLSGLLLSIILLLYLIAAFLLSDKIYLTTAKDIVNVIILLIIIFITSVFVTNKNDLDDFKRIFLWLCIFLGIIVAFSRIYYFLYVTSYSDQYNDLYLHLNRDIVDSNFALVPVFFGTVAVMNALRKKVTGWELVFYTGSLLLFSFAILLSGSKRGAFLFFILLAVNFVLQAAGFFLKDQQIKVYLKNIRTYLISITLLIIASVALVVFTQVYFKNSILRVAGVKNIPYTKNLISETIFKYVHFINKNLNENIIYSKVWRPVFDPKDPEAWYGNGNYGIMKKLPGSNAGIVPADTRGYVLDKNCLGFASPGHSYLFLPVKNETATANDSITASIYCYVSEEFDGTGAALRAEGAVSGNPDQFYDLNRKGIWQKLRLKLKCTGGEVRLYMYMNKAGVKDFSNLNGNVIFAYPEVVLKSAKKITDADLNLLSVFSSAITVREDDPIRKWFARLISEDTTYHNYKANLVFKKADDNFGEDRTARWKFALEIFNKEYNLKQKIFGGGFNFLSWYGKCFLGDKTKTDYPHNPFLHILLYSGLLGLVLYIILILRVLYIYIVYRKFYIQFFLLFLLTFYFTLFSGGNPFDPPVMGFFVMFPFLIHSVLKSDQLNSTKAL